MITGIDRDPEYAQFFRIEICGGIASGKTTLAKLIGNASAACALENFAANPFWKEFYFHPDIVAFETELTFLLLHYNSIKSTRQKKRFIICDFSTFLDCAYAEVTLTESRKSAFISVYNEIIREIGFPNLVVYLRCGSMELQRRIRNRRRKVETAISLDFINALNGAIERQLVLSAHNLPIVEIDSEKCNFAYDDKAKKDVIELISRAIGVELIGPTLDDT